MPTRLTEYLPIKLSEEMRKELEAQAENRGYKASTLARHLIAIGLAALREGKPLGDDQPCELPPSAA